MSFRDFPFPDEGPLYPHYRGCLPTLPRSSLIVPASVLTYLQSYARAFDLERHIRFNTPVRRLYLSPDYERRWTIESRRGKETYDFVTVANGHYSDVWVPEIAGLR